MPIVTTDAGRNATVNAEAGGFLVDLFSFAVTEKTDATLSVLDEQLQGPVVYAAEISSIEPLSESTVRCTCYIPKGYPQSVAEWNIGELGIYLKDGTLFVHARLATPFKKTPDFGLKFYVLVTQARLGEVVNVTLGNYSSLASAAAVRNLVPPTESETNVVIVQDQITNLHGGTSGSIAVRYGSGGSSWGFIGYDLKATARPDQVTNPGKFALSVNDKGFWLDDDEIVIGQVYAGPGIGESRRIRFNKAGNLFTVLEKPFSNLSTSSILRIWRNSGHQLPERKADVPEFFVLGVGKNTWQADVAAPTSASTITPGFISYTSLGVNTFTLPAGIPTSTLNDINNFVVFVDGKEQPVTALNISGTTITIGAAPIPSGTIVEIVYYKTAPSNGSAFNHAIAEYDADEETTFALPLIPDNEGYAYVFVEGEFAARSTWNIVGTNVVFAAPQNGKVIIDLSAAFLETGSFTTLTRRDVTLAIGQKDVTIPSVGFFEKKNAAVYASGRRLSQDDFTVSSGKVSLNQAVTIATIVSVVVFSSQTVLPNPASASSGVDTGPQWVDPAGWEDQPNMIVPKVKQYTGNGNVATYPIFTVRSAGSFIVMVGGSPQSPEFYTYDGAASAITMMAPAGVSIDIICFTEQPSDGMKVVCETVSLTTTASATIYPLGLTDPALPTMIFVGNVYQHRNTYSVSNGNLIFNSQPPKGMKIEAWCVKNLPHPGFRTNTSIAVTQMLDGKLVYDHGTSTTLQINDPDAVLENTLAFVGGAYQSKNQYTTAKGATAVDPHTINFVPPVTGLTTTPLITVILASGGSRTRLMTRLEVESEYMRKDGAGVMVAFAKAQPQIDMPIRPQTQVDLTVTVTVPEKGNYLVIADMAICGAHKTQAGETVTVSYYGDDWTFNGSEAISAVSQITLDNEVPIGLNFSQSSEVFDQASVGSNTVTFHLQRMFVDVPPGVHTFKLNNGSIGPKKISSRQQSLIVFKV